MTGWYIWSKAYNGCNLNVWLVYCRCLIDTNHCPSTFLTDKEVKLPGDKQRQNPESRTSEMALIALKIVICRFLRRKSAVFERIVMVNVGARLAKSRPRALVSGRSLSL